MGVCTDGSYGIPEGIVYSYPLTIGSDREWKIVQGLSIDDFSREKMDATAKELVQEKESCQSFLEWLASSSLWVSVRSHSTAVWVRVELCTTV